MGCSGCELWSKEGMTPERCYAAALHKMRGGVSKGYAPYFGLPTLFAGRTAMAARSADLTGKPRVSKPWLNGMPRLIFTSDMSDALSIGEHIDARDLEVFSTPARETALPASSGQDSRRRRCRFEYLEAEIVDVAESKNGSRHIWQWLTKLPGRASQFSAWLRERGKRWPANLRIGTSITQQASLSRK